MFSVRSRTPAATARIATALAELTTVHDLIVLTGDIGAGKTTFVQAFAPALGVTDEITSPTFTLAHRHDGRLRLNHLDLYRLESADELLDLDLPDLLSERAVTVIEWGERFLAALPLDYLQVRIDFVREPAGDALPESPRLASRPPESDEVPSAGEREITFETVGARWESRADALEGAVRGASE